MLPSDNLVHQLRRLFSLRSPEVGEPPKALEEALVKRMRSAPRKARRSVWSFLGDHRWALAGVGLAVGACSLPVDYQRSFGASVECTIADTTLDEATLQEMSEELQAAVGAESIALRVMRTDDVALVRVDVWGDLEDEEDALQTIRELAPTLADASCTAQALEGTVHGTLGGRLGYNLLDLDLLDRDDASATREAILLELSAQGFRGSAEVLVEDDGNGQRKVKISLEESYELEEGESPPEDLEIRGLGGHGEIEVEHERVLHRAKP